MNRTAFIFGLTFWALPASADVALSSRADMGVNSELPCSYAGQSIGHATYEWTMICQEPSDEYEPWQQEFLARCPGAQKPPFFSGGPDMHGWFDVIETLKVAFPEKSFDYDPTKAGDHERYTNEICDHSALIGLLEQG